MDRIQSSRNWGNDTGGQDGFETARVPLVTLRRGEGAVLAAVGTTAGARELAHGLSRLGFRAGRSILVVATSIRMTAAYFALAWIAAYVTFTLTTAVTGSA